MSPEPQRVLVVDDELGMREGCRKILESEGYVVVTAEDGQAGWEAYQADRGFIAAFVDIKMPRMSGIELVEKIRAIDDDIILFIITAFASIDTAVDATKKGAYGYIPKPFTPDELLMPFQHGLERRRLAMEAKRLTREREDRLLELAFERSKSGAVLQCMADGVLVVNAERRVVMHNGSAARMIDGLDSLPVPFDLSALPVPALADLIDTSLAHAGPSIETRELRVNDRTMMVNVSTLADSATTRGAVAVLRDITELKKLETAKSMFVSMVAHEVKRPIGVIEGYLNIVLSGLSHDPNKDREVLERSLIRARSLRQLVTELMNLTALETGHFTAKRVPVDLKEIVDEAVDACRDRAAEKGVDIDVLWPDGDALVVMADREAMQTAIGNLVDNAVKYTAGQSPVAVEARRVGATIRVAVMDHGIGIEPADQVKIFEEFFRVRNRFTATVPGTGLGLSLVRRLVELHEGRISVASEPGKGSTFTVILPAAEETRCAAN